ncbi:MAG: ABC transporter ATP-binding protein [Candidatus Rokubacteria bacterium]|nr:ABC transporter ATP-binding protein [Candidatus Rokubacteria bacterium]MBI2554733.1 ABC transporter ATP-binding protein [Candidatus Rokubacteria bacterium]
MALLEGRGLSMAFGGLLALRGVDIAVEEHQVVGLLGPNGSGKTTLFNILSGLLRPTAGEVWFAGCRVTNLAPWRLSGLGIGRTFQIARPFAHSTVFDNVLVGITFRSRHHYRRVLDRRREAERLLAMVGLAPKASARANELSLGERKRLELAMALSTRPTVLLLDELASGLSPKGREEVIRFYGRLKERGLTIFAIEHSFRVLAHVADRLVVLDQGTIVAEGRPAQVLGSPRVMQAYLGEDE